MHAGARGFSAYELAPATSEGELVTDLLQSAAAELGTPAGSSVSSSDGSGYGERRGRHHFRARLSVRLIDYECAPHPGQSQRSGVFCSRASNVRRSGGLHGLC